MRVGAFSLRTPTGTHISSGGIIHEIAEATEGQTAKIQKIRGGIDQVSQITHQTSVAAQQNASA